MFTYTYNEDTKEYDIYNPDGYFVRSVPTEPSAIILCSELYLEWLDPGRSEYDKGRTPVEDDE